MINLQWLTLTADQTLRQAMMAIDRGTGEIALVIDDRLRLIGTLTDGDIRRALLAGASMDDAVEFYMNRHFTAVSLQTGRVAVLDLMKARSIRQIPVIDEIGRLVGLHLMREIIGAEERDNVAVIMAGGRGERLRPLTDLIPKPMIRVAGRPILERIVLHLVGYGIRHVYLAVNYLAEVIAQHFGDGREFGCRIEYLQESQPLGTGGALSLLTERPKMPFLVLNGDLLTQFDAASMLAFHESHEFKATVGVYDYLHTVPFGVIESNSDRISRMWEKPTQVWLVNSGIYVFSPDLIERVPAATNFPLPALVEECLERNEPVGAFHIGEDWIDIGRHQELKRARGEVTAP